jgi:hypothetical protein
VFLFFLQKNDANVFFVLVFACLASRGLPGDWRVATATTNITPQ